MRRTTGSRSAPVLLAEADDRYPTRHLERLGADAPLQLVTVGNLDLLAHAKIALFCSARCPGSAILATYDRAAQWREEGRCIISGFHSPVEKECLSILLRGSSPIIICPGRAIEAMRISAECRTAFDSGRMLCLSPFTKRPTRVTKESASRRNEVVAALADEAYIAHVAPGGKTSEIVKMLNEWKVSML